MTQKRSTSLGGITNLSVLAPIRQGMVIGFEPISYRERLRKVLEALHSARQNIRESELRQPFFPDAVGRFGIIHFFRYAIVPPRPGKLEQPQQQESEPWHLSLNVTFDGGWEPYMRVIYRDIGTLLDLLFCHCDGYPGSDARFESYCEWVRANEVEGGLFYADSAMSLGDQVYLAQVERLQREQCPAPDADVEASPQEAAHRTLRFTDRTIEQTALPSIDRQYRDAIDAALKDPVQALVLPLRTLKGLYRLSTYFPSSGEHDEMPILRRFAQAILEGPREVIARLEAWLKKVEEDPFATPEDVAKARALAPELQKTRAALRDELQWLEIDAQARPVRILAKLKGTVEPPPDFELADIQSHILSDAEQMTHGCIVLLRVTEPAAARERLAEWARLCEEPPRDNRGADIGCAVGLTYEGLKALGIAQHRLTAFPQEFVDGMEARSALLGDVRANHPDQWVRPRAYGSHDDAFRIDLKTVHVLVHLRLRDDSVPAEDITLHPRLKEQVADLAAAPGLKVVALQDARNVRNGEGKPDAGHFKLVDGISQPQVARGRQMTEAATYNNHVSAGELLLGRGNDRGDKQDDEIDELLCDGSFLVVRRLCQRVDHLASALAEFSDEEAQRDDLLAHMLGRRPDGTPLVKALAEASDPKNDFNYEKNPHAAPDVPEACPFHAHIRRANPRDPERYTPRILRRGMSYGPKSTADLETPRGIFFMAYCASISEQFETIQRWIAGGNSTGVGSAQGDPFLRVPVAGEKYTFRYVDDSGQVVRMQFDDDKPLVQLEWGLYLFVPSLPVLRDLTRYVSCPSARKSPAVKERAPTEEEQREQLRQILDDKLRAPSKWAEVRATPDGILDTAYGRLVGTCPGVLEVLRDREASRYSVAGYGERMHLSIGLNRLGMDPGVELDRQAALNEAIWAIKEEEAFDLTLSIVQEVLGEIAVLPLRPGERQERRPIDVVSFSDAVMARLCTHWIGLPEPSGTDDPFMVEGGRLDINESEPRCPGNFATVSRYIFSPQPRPGVVEAGRTQGKAVLEAVKGWLAREREPLGELAQKIRASLRSAGVAVEPGDQDDTFALSIAGVLLGFPPTVQGNFVRVMENWIESEALWVHRQALVEAYGERTGRLDHACAEQALRAVLFDTMRKRPVPEMLWRSPVDEGEPITSDPSRRIVLGLTSALTDEQGCPKELIFGRDADDSEEPTLHGCPGYPMAMGVLLAMFAGLMMAGTLRPTGSSVLLILARRLPDSA